MRGITAYVLAILITIAGSNFSGGSAQAATLSWSPSEIIFPETPDGSSAFFSATLTAQLGGADRWDLFSDFTTVVLTLGGDPQFPAVFTVIAPAVFSFLNEVTIDFRFDPTVPGVTSSGTITATAAFCTFITLGPCVIGSPAVAVLNVSGTAAAIEPPAVIPLPAALPLFLTGLAGLGLLRRRQRQAQRN